MREIILSDHVKLKIAELENTRLAKDAEAMQAFEKAVQDREQRINAAAKNWQKAKKRWWNLFNLLHAWFQYKKTKGYPVPQKPVPLEQSIEERQLRAGQASEDSVANSLSELLPGNAWVLIRGYRNGKGEIDQILVGPTAIIAMEIKYRKARISCKSDDEWYEERLDSWNNIVEPPKRISDKKGRSPSKQLLEPVTALRHFLKRRNVNAEIYPVVVLSHPYADVGACNNLSVHLVPTLEINGLVWKACKYADQPVPVESVVNLITKDHEHWKSNGNNRTGMAKPEAAISETMAGELTL